MANQQRRRKRRTSSRITTGKTRKISIVESEDEVRQPLGDNWYYQNKIGQYYFSQSPNTQVYFAKVAFGVISGFIIGFFYFIDVVAKNWFLIPIMGVLFIGVMARRFLHIDKETITDLKLYAWTGTISLFIGFICASVLMYLLFNSPAVVF